MLDSLIQFHDHLPFLIRWPIDFFFYVVLIRGILATEILSEMQQRGFYKKGILDRTVKKMDKWYSVARKSAILEHYRLRAHGAGHNSESVLDCGQGRCHIF